VFVDAGQAVRPEAVWAASQRRLAQQDDQRTVILPRLAADSPGPVFELSCSAISAPPPLFDSRPLRQPMSAVARSPRYAAAVQPLPRM